MPSMPVGEARIKVVPDFDEFFQRVESARQAMSFMLAADPLARAIVSTPPGRGYISAAVDGREFLLNSWTLHTRDGVEYLETQWGDRRELEKKWTIPWRLRYKGYWVKPRAMLLRLRRRLAI